MSIRVGINGFGRIGRSVFRAALDPKNKDIEIVHINDLTDTKTLAHLLKHDSVHGKLQAEVGFDETSLTVNGKKITVSKIKAVADLPWKSLNVDIVFECTGIFTKKADAELHLKAGAKSVLISAPATDEDITVVYGVNHEKLNPSIHKIVSNASCTTNCLAPFTKVIQEKLGIKRGLMTTVHSYTNDQNILDLPHKDLRRARAAALSMIPTSTGAAKAIGLVMPELKGKLDGLAVRVPTPNVSLVDVTFEVSKPTTVEDVNRMLKDAANGPLKGILAYSDEPLVSVDYNGDTSSSSIDGLSTKVIDQTLVKILSWYDNETGFSWRMLDVARLMAK
ncbi:MAG: type I glyceraldehyde-3-phosphate dehydrogenase [Proteobacteria bacterium]|nr:type I glyceraldehyde-3-phosphate dehydrogenase [Pseudomonadota bacterium]